MPTILTKSVLRESDVSDTKNLVDTLNKLMLEIDTSFAPIEVSRPTFITVTDHTDHPLNPRSRLTRLLLKVNASKTLTVLDQNCDIGTTLQVDLVLASGTTLTFVLDSLNIPCVYDPIRTYWQLVLHKSASGWLRISTYSE